jgi:pyruvate formate lyase activating enzyme
VESDNIETEKPSVFSIQHFCLQDGPGIRSIVFFKGCPLRCTWCQNPESWHKKPELAFKAHLCISCKTCVDSCQQDAMLSPGNRNKSLCRLCFACVETCPSSALTRFGRYVSIDDIMEELRPEYAFYKNSSGGVTFSGGEPTLFPDFAARLALSLKKDNIHLAMETCGMFQLNGDNKPYGKMWDFISILDLVIFDVKVFDNDAHREYCGSGNELIKQNLKHLSELKQEGLGPDIWPRLPVIPGITDTSDNLSGWASFLLENNFTAITLVPYHNMGGAKRPWIGLESGPGIPSLTDQALDSVRHFFTQKNISCFNPGEEAM